MKLFEQLANLCFYKENILARNVLFNHQSETFLKELEEKGDSSQVKKYIKSNLKNWIINEYKAKLHKPKSSDPDWVQKALDRGDEIYDINITDKDKNKFEHWIDFLNNYPKLNSISKISVPQLIEMIKGKESKVKSKEDGIKIIHVYPNGYKWVEIFGNDSLIKEGRIMQNCLKDKKMNWSEKLSDGMAKIYSLRDNNDEPHITIEFNPHTKKLEQIQGKQNEPPIPKYIPYLIDFLNKNYIGYSKGDFNINLLPVENLPDNFMVNGNLNLSTADIQKLPNNFTVNGNLDLSFSKIKHLPIHLVVEDNLDLSHSKVEKIPNDLTVKGNLNLSYTNIRSIPDNFKVGGDLILDNTKIEKLPDNLKVGRNLSLTNTPIKRLPDDFIVEGNLILGNTEITKLPENLTVKGSLSVRNSKITKLPDSLTVGKLILCSEGQLTYPAKFDDKIMEM